MKKHLIFLLLIVSVVVNAQVLWQVRNKSGKNTSYLVATHALIPAKAFDSIPGVFRGFNKCNVVVSTYDSYSVEAEAQLKKAALLPFQKSMKDYLADSVYQKVDTELKKTFKTGLKELGLMHPAMIRQLYLNELFKQAINIDDDAQTDSYFQRVAALKGISVIGLENYNLQLNAMLDATKIKMYANKLAVDVLQSDKLKSEFGKLYRAFLSNNITLTADLLNKTAVDTENFYKPLTENQLIKLTDLMNSNNCFYTLDIRMLSSENGLIAALEKSGFEVKPYKISGNKRK